MDVALQVLFNALVLTVEVLAILTLRARPEASPPRAVALVAVSAVALALAVGRGMSHPFPGAVLLLAWAVFLHGPLTLLAVATARWGTARAEAAGLGLLGLALAAVAVDAFVVEPRWLETSHYELPAPGLSRPVRVVVLADIQADRVGRWERTVEAQVAALEPDLVLMPGDHTQVPSDEWDAVAGELASLLDERLTAAPLGLHAVRGNAEPRSGWEAPFSDTRALTYPSTTSVEVAEGLVLTALSAADSRRGHLSLSRPGPGFHVVMGHHPDFALGSIDAELLVAGHTHGGQVVLPLLGPVFTLTSVPRDWASGLTALPGGGTLLVSRGVGMERGLAPRLRFLCRPEVVVVDLVPVPP